MLTLHKAALIRAYRTLAQGLGGSAITTALTALLVDGETALKAAGIAAGTVLIMAIASFFQGVVAGLPEADTVEGRTP